jgi:membrane protein YdbS with pleckstrin-like domain
MLPLLMITPEEEKFLVYWQANRSKEKSFFKQLSLGMPLGLLMGVGIILSYVTGWYKRANMVANSQSTPLVLIIALIIIVVFCSVFYKRHKWEMNEQYFLELKVKKEKEDSQG